MLGPEALVGFTTFPDWTYSPVRRRDTTAMNVQMSYINATSRRPAGEKQRRRGFGKGEGML